MGAAVPHSVTSQWINAAGLAAMLVATLVVTALGVPAVIAAFLCLLAYGLPVAALELGLLKVHRRASTGLDWDRAPLPVNWQRVGIKLMGFFGALGAVVLVHWAIRLYQIDEMASVGTLLLALSWIIAPVVIAYFIIVDRVMIDPHDGYWQAGTLLLGRSGQVDWQALRAFGMGWVVKGLFLPIMLVYLVGAHQRLQINIDMLTSGHVLAVRWLTDFVAACELAIVCVGYTLTVRALDAHIRSTNPFLGAWLVTLACYEPFNQLVSGRMLKFNDELFWYDWLGGSPILSWLWAMALLASFAVWLWATAAFGLRWSNLTNRGIITNGPYRFTKHPDYLAKSVFFWLIHIPFLSLGGPIEALRACLLLALFNGIYFLRARMEEKHLSADPDYVAYAMAMNQRGLFSQLGRLVPALRYTPAPA